MEIKSTKSILLGLISSVAIGLTQGEARSEGTNELVTQFCLAGFEAEMEKSDKPLNKSIGTYTCDCFVNKFSNGLSFEKARELCKEEAYKRFNLQR